ncbi:hypothetical protein [Spirosoma aerolatum]|uniref:hypothetical protein n=1 Tax=Spirosoma aerolatum TaxID=1211326 RepID=UPI0009ADAEEC|nr:hypothetical protein [Spirosoma aerolatum]
MAKADELSYWQPFTKAGQTSQWVSGLKDHLNQATQLEDSPWQFDRGSLQTCLTPSSFWIVYSFATAGKLAIRTCFDPQTIHAVKRGKQTETTVEYRIDGSLGAFRVMIERCVDEPMLLRYTTSLKPNQDFIVEAFPRDVYLLNKDGDPTTTEGMVYVTQSGPTAGLTYLSVTKPIEGTLLYFQNLTALNDYCQQTHTDPSGTVDAQWPEVGFSLPAAEQPLKAGKEVIISDAFLYLNEGIPANEFEAADMFLKAIPYIYRQLPKPEPVYFDWPKAAEQTIRALANSPECGRRIRNQFYLNAYVSATQKPPESMVQLAILVPLWEYQEWLEKPVPLVELLQKAIPTFFDEKKATLTRWLPGESFKKDEPSEEEDINKIDSWYLLHILMNLGRLADKGNTEAKDLLFRSLEFVIRAAHHFGYNWPVFYDSRTLAVIKAETSEGKGGELDAAGLFTHVMVQAYELSKDPRYLQEAEQSAERLRGKGFELLYQSNITIMSALTLVKLWRITGKRLYFDLSRLSIANVIARMWIWECNFGLGQFCSTFMGVAPLKDAPYLAAYEEAEIMATMLNYLKELGNDVIPAARLVFAEFIKYLLHRGRYYFPSELPADMICSQPREGRMIPDLPIPVEDISTGWKQVGAVGQEVYGGALAYILTTYAYKRFEGVPVIIYCNYPIYQADYQIIDRKSGYAIFCLSGLPDYTCQVRILAKGSKLPAIQLLDEDSDSPKPFMVTSKDKTYQEFTVPGNLRLRLEWGPTPKSLRTTRKVSENRVQNQSSIKTK